MNYDEIANWYDEHKEYVVNLDIKSLVTSLATIIIMDKKLSGKPETDDDQHIAIFLSKAYAMRLWNSGTIAVVVDKKPSELKIGDQVIIANPREYLTRLKSYIGTIINSKLLIPDGEISFCVRYYEPCIKQDQNDWFTKDELKKFNKENKKP